MSSQNNVLFLAILCSSWQSVAVSPVEEVTELLAIRRHYLNRSDYVALNEVGLLL
jgi:hypothetical protein